MKFNTLRTLTEDLLLIVRGSKVSESELISRRQLENWIHQYRALLIARDLDKGYLPNPDYIQQVGPVDLVAEGTEKVTSTELPRVIDRNYKSGFTFVGKADGCEIQMIPEHRKCWQNCRKYTSNDPVWYLGSNDGKIHVVNGDDIDSIIVRGIFENPAEVGSPNFTMDTRYPVPNNMAVTIKEMILSKELGIEAKAPSDNKNDDDLKFSQQSEAKYS